MMETQTQHKHFYSRRSFLKRLSLGAAGAFVASAFMGKLPVSPGTRHSDLPDLPEDSIFRPAQGQAPRSSPRI